MEFINSYELNRHEPATKFRLCTDHMRVSRTVLALIAFVALITTSELSALDSETPAAATAGVPLATDQVVDNLVRRNQERAQALRHSEATRVYRVVYKGLPSDRVAEMTVQATYDRPSSKEFTIISQSGSKLIAKHVFKKLLESEKEAAAGREYSKNGKTTEVAAASLS